MTARRVQSASGEEDQAPARLSDHLEDALGLEVPAKTVDLVLREPEAIAALDDLDIGRADHPFLADILVSDNSGSINIHEFVDVLRRLRGKARRSDIVSVDLVVRCIQRQLLNVHGRVVSTESNLAVADSDASLGRAASPPIAKLAPAHAWIAPGGALRGRLATFKTAGGICGRAMSCA